MLGRMVTDDLGSDSIELRKAAMVGVMVVQEVARRRSSPGKQVPAGEYDVDLRIRRSSWASKGS